MAWTERYCSVAGGGTHDGTSAANAWTFAEARTNAVASHRVNMLQGTYNIGADISFSTATIWWRGYHTTIGDCDTDPTLARPVLTGTGDQYIATAATDLVFSSINMTGARSFAEGTLRVNAARNRFYRCKITNTSNNASSVCVQCNEADPSIFESCRFEGGTTLGNLVYVRHNTSFFDCVFEGGADAVHLDSAGGTYARAFVGCIFFGQGDDAIRLNTTGSVVNVVDRCTFYNIAGDAIYLESVGTLATVRVSNCIFSTITGYGINAAAATSVVRPSHNLFHAVTAGQTNNLGDTPAFATQTSGTSPFVNAASEDFTPVGTALETGSPGAFET